MHQSIDKKNKVLLYLILLLILSTINNKKIDNQNKNLTKVTIINVSGLSEDKNLQIINKINKLINKNIFFINKKKLIISFQDTTWLSNILLKKYIHQL